MKETKPHRVGIAAFKARLSAYLRGVRRGEAITLYDRNMPVARVVPVEPEGGVGVGAGSGALRVREGLTPEEPADRRGTAYRLLEAVSLADVSTPILRRAADPFPTPLGTLDAIHLATALAWRDARREVVMATHDAQLALAARACGFEVLGAA